jgi:nucleoside-diphosphate-sugar epimerase
MVGGMPRYAATAGAPFAAHVTVDVSASAASVKPLLEGVDGLVIGQDVAPASVRVLLDAAGDAAVGHVVLLSSATVYGAWANNPVPLSEDASLRPNPGFPFAADRAEAERLVAEWKDGHPGATATVLRPAVVIRGGALTPLDHALSGTAGLRPREASRPVQFLAEEDVASAVALALAERLDGPYNVAPDGWVPDETARALAGGPARVAVPERLARVLRAMWPGPGHSPWPGIDPYTRHPWVVANDRLRAAGWTPAQSNEEAFVDVAAGRWPELSPKHRQEVALGVSVAALVGAAAAVVAFARRRRSRS